MKRLIIGGAMAAAALAASGAQAQSLEERVRALEEKAEGKGTDLKMYWKEGIHFDSNDGNFKFKLNGRIQNDWAVTDYDDTLTAAGFGSDDGIEFRRARLAVSGKIYNDFEFKAQYDFAGGTAFKDVWMAANHVPGVGQIKVGHFKEPLGLEELTSSNDITFMERTTVSNVFAPSRNTGIAFSRNFLDDQYLVSAGFFKTTDDDFGTAVDDAGDDGNAITARISGRPWLNEEGDQYLHVGAAVSHRVENATAFEIEARPEVHLADKLIDGTALGPVGDIDIFGFESALVYGPFSVQGEYGFATIERTAASDMDVTGFYVEGSWFLTGEHRRYKAGAGAFDKVKPKNNFNLSEGGGLGAWQLAARFSSLDAADGAVDAGQLDDITAAINWYLNPNMRIGLNYVHAEFEQGAVDGAFDAVQGRFQVTW